MTQHKPKSKLGRDIVPGDKLITDEGDVVTVTSVCRSGIIEGALLISWLGGCGLAHPYDKVATE